MNLQDAFLNQVRVQKIPVTVNLVGGQQMRGFIRGFDSFIIVLEIQGKNNLIYKHSVTNIAPSTNVVFFRSDEVTPESKEADKGE